MSVVAISWSNAVCSGIPFLSVSKMLPAHNCVGQGNLDEADPLLVRAIEIQERALSPDHPSLANSLGTRATVLKAQVREYIAEIVVFDVGDLRVNIP